MPLFKYFSRETSTTKASSSLTIKEKEIVRVFVKNAENQGRGKYNDYTPEERAAIGMYVAENGPGRACKHFTKVNVMSPCTAFNRYWHTRVVIFVGVAPYYI